MGMVVQAQCDCGYESEHLLLGVGMSDIFDNTFSLPGVCQKCKKVVAYNGNAKRRRCPACRSALKPLHSIWSSDQVRASPDGELIFSLDLEADEVAVLPDQEYRCPRCGKEQMKLFEIGLWD